MVTTHTYAFTPASGPALTAYHWPTNQSCKAQVLFVHGWGDHAQRYAEVAIHLAGLGYDCHGLDFPGHGQSPGLRAHVSSFSGLVDCLHQWVEQCHRRTPELPIYLCGHSMGGCIATTYALQNPHPSVSGLLLIAPALAVSAQIAAWKITAAKCLGSWLPKLAVSKVVRSHQISRDPHQVARYRNDPLMHRGKMTAGTGKQLFNAMLWLEPRLGDCTLPVFIAQGTLDPLVNIEGAKQLAAKAKHPDTCLQLYPDALHDLFHESNREQVLEDLCNWLATN